tara:strand:- start:216 stop:740 length:525 start_codon:yes stop_codon:yes gene_type:complete
MNYPNFLEYLKEHDLECVLSRACHKSAPWFFSCEKQFNKILEIGRCKGHSLAIFKLLWPDSYLLSIDTILHPEVAKVLDHFKGKGITKLLHGNVRKLNETTIFNLVFIDGDHTQAGALKDWNGIQKNIKKGSIVVFDDLDHGYGCGKVFYNLQSEYKSEIVKANGVEVAGVLFI